MYSVRRSPLQAAIAVVPLKLKWRFWEKADKLGERSLHSEFMNSWETGESDWPLESLDAWSHGIRASLYWDARLQLFPVILSKSGCEFGSELVTAFPVLEIQLIFALLSGCFPKEENELCYMESTTDSLLLIHSFLQSNFKETKTTLFPKKKWCTFFLVSWKYSGKKCVYTIVEYILYIHV